MSEAADGQIENRDLSAEEVAAFLQRRPDFFDLNPEVLHDLKLPHVSGEAVSLFDRQLASLRDENRRLKSNQQMMIDNARANEALIKRIHGLALQLMQAAGPAAIFDTLKKQLKQDFNADRVELLIFASAGFDEKDAVGEFVGNQDPRQSVFESLSAADGASCGALAEDHRRALWPNESDIAGSNALLPLNAKSWRGILAIQSDDPERFVPDMGTEFLSYISDIVCLVVDPWVSRESA